MARINLLPWREERRAALQKQFLVVLAGMAVFGALLVFYSQMVWKRRRLVWTCGGLRRIRWWK